MTDMANQMAQFAMSQMWSMDPYGQYPLKEEKPPVGPFASSWAALQQAATMATRTVTPPQRRKANPVPHDAKDEAYYERRRKNNDSAKRSRENRRLKEQEYQMKADLLLQENMQLREMIKQLQSQILHLRSQLAQQWPVCG